MKHVLFFASLFGLALLVHAQDEPTPAPDTPAPAAAPAATNGPGGGRGGQNNNNEPRPYDRVITKEAKTQKGVFQVHQVGQRYYFEIPTAELGRDFLWVSEIARNTIGAGNGGQPTATRVVRWERRENRVLLRELNFEVTADPTQPIARAVEASKNPAIIMSFNVDANGPDNAPVIDVTRLYSTDVPEFSARTRLRARALDASRTFIEHITAFPSNIEVEATHTYTSPTDPTPGQGGGRGGPTVGGNAMRPGTGTVLMHFSMVKLPEHPMTPRLYDARVGFFTTSTTDYSRPEHRAERRTFIARWRLEKKDPTAAVSEPVQPIVYYLDPATPKQWIPYLKRGIESWQPAFEAAGFKNAIIAKEAPTPEEDPQWSPDDIRYSVVRWLPSTIENAMGPHISDPRTGEILNADIEVYHNVMQLAQDWYFIQAGPLDPRASKLPLPDTLMGDLLTYVLAHEVGHTLGLQHDMKGSSLYPVDKLRDPAWLKTMGHTPSIMDYSRFNYVAQPEDKIDPKDLIPKVGPYDTFAIQWGYTPIDGVKTPDDEKKTLDTWARRQDKEPWLRFNTENSRGADAGENTEAVGDADAVYSTGLGLKNLQRVMDNLLAATTHDGEDWRELNEVYGRVLGQWSNEMGHVAQIIGSFDSQEKHGGQGSVTDGVRFTPLSRGRQFAAMKFLNENAFATPNMFLRPEILRRIEPVGALDRIRTAQLRVLTSLMSPQRFGRLVEQEAIDGAAAYKPSEFLTDVRKGVFSEMYGPQVRIDAYRRNLQRGYLDLMATRLNGPQRATDDQRPMFRGELRTIAADAATALARTTDRDTRLHLEDLRDQVAKILDPKFQQSAPTINPAIAQQTTADDEDAPAEEICFPDYAIR
ncbi:MAG TPA: zinc-dependent metalloprotease [Bryobacteraceae bacterium]|nr:zinc-dependent metalloprotease [Bryobacteraceae bacterium]